MTILNNKTLNNWEEAEDIEALAQTLTFNTSKDRALVFEKRGDVLYITIHHNGECLEYRRWFDKIWTAVLILNVKNKKKKFFIKEKGEAEYRSLIPSLQNILPWVEINPRQKWDFKAHECVCEKNQFTDPIFVGSRKEVLKGTLIELFEKGEEIPLSEDSVPSGIQKILGLKTLQDWVKYYPKLFWEILLGDNTLEQLLKGGMPYLAMEMLRSRYVFNADKDVPRHPAHHRIGIHQKEQQLKKCFGLSIKQIKCINTFIKEKYLANLSSTYSERITQAPMIPAIYKMDEVLGVQLNCLDLKTFESLLKLSNQSVNASRRTWFSWCGFSEDYPSLKEVTQKLKPAEFAAWLGKEYNLEEYNDYLVMRNKLKQISVDTNQPGLFSERAFPIKVKEPTEVHRLHDIVSKINLEYEDAAKSAMFNNALKEAKHYEFEDKKTEKEERMMAILPESVADLVAEGTELHHCVKNAMWIDAIAERKSVIMFIRRCEHKDKPFFTVELDPEGRIRQCHGLRNCDPDTEVVKFLCRWTEAKKGVLKDSISEHYEALAPNR